MYVQEQLLKLGILLTRRQTETHRPVIWICHDLGGTIVKEVVVTSYQRLYLLTISGTVTGLGFTQEIRKNSHTHHCYRKSP